MVNRWKILLATWLVFINVDANSQALKLTLGDILPEFTVEEVEDGVLNKKNTKKYLNELLIVDFWNTGCGSCIQALPKFHMLEKKYYGKLTILPVTHEPANKVISFWKSNKVTKDIKMKSVVNDKNFASYFRHLYVPHEVWIYRGKVIAVTDLEYVDSYNIEKVLSGLKVSWPLKDDFSKPDTKNPLFALNHDQIDTNSTFVEYTAISDYKSDVNPPIWFTGGSGIVRDSIKGNVRSYFYNQPILTSYVINWMKALNTRDLIKPNLSFQPNQVIWDVYDKSQYAFFAKPGSYTADWLIKNAICYESVVKDVGQRDEDIYRKIISDIDRLLGLDVRWVTVSENVLLLKKTVVGIAKDVSNNLKGTSISLYDVGRNLNEQYNNPYVFVGDSVEGVHVKLLHMQWSDIESINSQLEKQGYSLVSEVRNVNKLLFKEVDGGRVINAMMIDTTKSKYVNSDLLTSISKLKGSPAGLINNTLRKKYKITQTGIIYNILKKGTTTSIDDKTHLSIHYVGAELSGKVFESTYESGIPTVINRNKVIPGWMEILSRMKKGDIWEIVIPSGLAYGTHTANGRIAPNSDLYFRIELINLID